MFALRSCHERADALRWYCKTGSAPGLRVLHTFYGGTIIVTAWIVLLTPLAVFVLLLLFGLVGCDEVLGLDEIPNPTYDKTIANEPDILAYWRLGEPSTTPVPSTGTAIDQIGGAHNGNYNVATINADAKRHANGAPGNITLGIQPGLLELKTPTDETKNPCIEVNGGFVEVPFDPVLNQLAFTFEAWLIPEFGTDPPNNFYCLVESSAPAGGMQKKFGFGLYIGPANPAGVMPQPYQWQVWMGNGNAFQQVAVANDTVKFNQLTYLALTFDLSVPTNNLILYLYYPGTGQDLTMASVAPLQATVTNFKPNNQPGGGSLLIGMGRNLYPGVAIDPVLLQPFLYAFNGKIQEAALYKSALGIAKLSNHELAGGMV